MRFWLQLLAVSALLAAGTTWLVTGANRGWTKTSLQTESVEPVTGMRVLNTVDKFLPGLDFLAAAFVVAGVLGGASFFFRKPKSTKTGKMVN